MAEERCVCCGEIIPEGWQTCLRCRSQEDGMKEKPRKKFECPVCGETIVAPVKYTALLYNGYSRYRTCEKCGTVFVTVERIIRLSERSKAKVGDPA